MHRGAGSTAVGERVGCGVGDSVGDAVGLGVGARVGSEVGSADGDRVGAAVGSIVGDAVGEEVGATVGDGVGQNVYSSPGSSGVAETGPVSDHSVHLARVPPAEQPMLAGSKSQTISDPGKHEQPLQPSNHFLQSNGHASSDDTATATSSSRMR